MWPPGLLLSGLAVLGLAVLGLGVVFSRGSAAAECYSRLLRCRLPYDTPDRFLGGCGRGGRIAGLLRAGPIIVVAFFLRHAVSFPHHTQQPCPAEREWPTGPGEQATDGRKRLTDRRKLV